jgi:hypothetical protein
MNSQRAREYVPSTKSSPKKSTSVQQTRRPAENPAWSSTKLENKLGFSTCSVKKAPAFCTMGWDEKSGVGSIIPKDIMKQKSENHPGCKLDKVMKSQRSYHQRHKKKVSSRGKTRGGAMSDCKGFVRGISPGIILLLVLLINVLGVVQAQADCAVLNTWLGLDVTLDCCDHDAITCSSDRIDRIKGM